jgi:glycosyltransferase involved in cell wall biosynthesis
MFPFTGGCHHSLECVEFKKECSNCPQVKIGFRSKIEHGHKELRSLSQPFEKLVLVSPSRWIQKMAQESAIMSGAKTFCIPNPIDSEIFNLDSDRREIRPKVDESEFIIGLCASDLSDPNKNIDAAIEAINSVAKQFPRRNICILAVGSNLKKYTLEDNIVIREVGSLRSDVELAQMYRLMDVFINPSLQENYPTTLLEALAVGTPCIAWRSNGAEEIVTGDVTGYLVDSPHKLIDAISKMLEHENLVTLRDQVAVNRNKIIDIKRCVELYDEVYQYDFKSNGLSTFQ